MTSFATTNWLVATRRALLVTVAALPTGFATRGSPVRSSAMTARRNDRPIISYYAIFLRVDPVLRLVSGVVHACGRSVGAAATIDLDLAATLRVDSVVVTERRTATRAAVERADGHLTIRPKTPWSAGARVDFTVFYAGSPSSDAVSFTGAGDSARVASYGMPYSAREWWPSQDSPSRKADSVDIAITAPAELTVVSNGRYVDRKEAGNGMATTRWAVRYLIYPDVVSMAIAHYTSFSLPAVAGGHPMPMTFYAFPEDEAKARTDFSVLPSILAFYETRFGPYPFAREKYGVAEFAVPSFREHQTIPSYGQPLITGDHRNDWILAHELAHQWFGDAVSVRAWDDVWLNEGLATYAALLWIEHASGSEAYHKAVAARMRQRFPTALHLADTMDVGHMFGPVTFAKGPVVLHMLRHVMGDSAFFGAVNGYVKANLLGTVSTATLQAACESAMHGRSLDWFFKEWVYGTGAPSYNLAWSQRRSRNGVDVDVAITQPAEGPVFTMPVDVALTTAAGQSLKTIVDTGRVFRATLTASDSVTAVILDPDNWILKRMP